MEKIKAIVIDDEVNNVDLLVHFLEKYCPIVEIIGKATTSREGKVLIEELQPQLIFLDIMLDEGTGFELLEDVTFTKSKVIFVTAFDEFAIKAFKFSAIDYVLKPIEIEELVLAVNKAHEQIKLSLFTEKEQLNMLSNSINKNRLPLNFIAIPSVDKIDFVKTNEIVFCNSEGRYTTFHLISGKEIVATKNLGEYEQTLDKNIFFRIHNSYIVNLTHVLNINKSGGNYCELVTGESIPIAKRRQDQLHRFLKIK
ncbi:LytR/AlgR family response regulator transcription factor [Sungkyunkwania multivorans]|uniref:LytR/AlgR family response regulator transcription factor n=1 Tax=Sungkyunkwania multivorans TaxID=1173618 RepID=A0ABW3CWW9_9FLAO